MFKYLLQKLMVCLLNDNWNELRSEWTERRIGNEIKINCLL